MVQSVSFVYTGFRALKAPLPAEGKEFLLTVDGQSVMNSFTAFGSVCNFVFVSRESTREKTQRPPHGKQLH
jgi:hypothetical protein